MGTLFYNIIIAPIELVVEIVFEFLFRIIGLKETNQGFVLIGVSLTISLLTLPLYRQADVIQKNAREKQKKMALWLSHIKNTFRGDERFMMTQAYYKINNYNPLSILESAVPLLLQIPFFTAAYHFLSNLEALQGANFGLITDLGKPDGLIKIGSLTLNLLPIMMTTINCVSGAVYLKGFALKDKMQTYGMALVFLFLLYNSPAGLVVYWTCNNIFSLVKNIFYKLKHPRKVIDILSAAFGVIFTIILFSGETLNSRKKYVAVLIIALCTFIPLILSLSRKYFSRVKKEVNNCISVESNKRTVFVLAGFFLVVLTGLLIPSSVISSSPSEFIDIENFKNPLYLMVNSTCYALGFFVVWFGIIYAMLGAKGRNFFTKMLCAFSFCALITFMFFGKKLGVISPTLVFDFEPSFSGKEKLFNFAIILLICGLWFLFCNKKIIKLLTPYVFLVLIICISGVAVNNIRITNKRLNEISYVKDVKVYSEDEEIKPIFKLSKTGKNVIVFMLDRAISGFVPMCFNEKPELQKQFAGFTYYPNTISFGMHTVYGAPGIFGGYEYSPTEMNKRDKELLSDKHNEALKMMPKVLSDKNYDVTVCDVPDANYQTFSDLSIFDDIANCNTYHLAGVYYNKLKQKYNYKEQNKLESDKRNFFCYSIFKIIPVGLQLFWYDRGTYYSTANYSYIGGYVRNYSMLEFLNDLTDIKEDDSDNLIVVNNEAAHNPVKLYLPDYTFVKTSESDKADAMYFFPTPEQRNHYHVNMASLLALGKWFDYMRKNGVYDNTRIVIVSDHGRSNNVGTNGLHYWDYMEINNPKMDVSTCNPLMMFKDFNSTEFTTSDEFMTNADVPTFVLKDLVDNPVNPFTGKKIDDSEKHSHPQLITSSHKYIASDHIGKTTFDTSDGHWYSVHDDIFKEENWEMVE
ncbi:MAG: YidC/Oxa1 family membrane protein insertase [Treponema sp.]|nr:YidC/Oxa1 family membrane protein insertase [Treponema sp.]